MSFSTFSVPGMTPLAWAWQPFWLQAGDFPPGVVVLAVVDVAEGDRGGVAFQRKSVGMVTSAPSFSFTRISQMACMVSPYRLWYRSKMMSPLYQPGAKARPTVFPRPAAAR